jgi:hypothetical protein
VKLCLSRSWENIGLRVFENGVLRGIFEPKREQIRGYLKIMNNIDYHQVHQGEQVKVYATGEACWMHERDEHCTHIVY